MESSRGQPKRMRSSPGRKCNAAQYVAVQQYKRCSLKKLNTLLSIELTVPARRSGEEKAPRPPLAMSFPRPTLHMVTLVLHVDGVILLGLVGLEERRRVVATHRANTLQQCRGSLKTGWNFPRRKTCHFNAPAINECAWVCQR